MTVLLLLVLALLAFAAVHGSVLAAVLLCAGFVAGCGARSR